MINTVMISEVYQNRYRSDGIDRRKCKNDRGIPRYEQNYRGENFRDNVTTYQHFERHNSRGEYINNYRDEGYNRSRDKNRSRERAFSSNFSNDRNNRIKAKHK